MKEAPPPVALYARILGFLKAHRPTLVIAVVAAALYALLDTAVYVLLIPFVEALFLGGGAGRIPSDSAIQRLLDATVYRWVDLGGDPLVAIGRIIVLIILVFLFKNVFLFARAYLMARVEQGVKRELLELVSLRGIGRVRARALYVSGLKTLRDVQRAEVAGISRIPGIGVALAKDVKAQVGQDVGKQKIAGQANLGEFD